MKFALVEGGRREAEPGFSGKCPACGDAMIPKCGKLRVWHWSHLVAHACDHWWESETEWHRTWKNQFPADRQEVVQWAENGEKHFADVKTESGVVIEFQHSNLRPEERDARETFYQNMVWVIDGLRRKTDRSRFFASLTVATIINPKPLTFALRSNENALLRQWAGSRVPVFFDFGDSSELGDAHRFETSVLWRLAPRSPRGVAHLTPVRKDSFPGAYIKGLRLKAFDRSLHFARAARAALYVMQQAHQSRNPMGFAQYMARKEMARRRHRF